MIILAKFHKNFCFAKIQPKSIDSTVYTYYDFLISNTKLIIKRFGVDGKFGGVDGYSSFCLQKALSATYFHQNCTIMANVTTGTPFSWSYIHSFSEWG